MIPASDPRLVAVVMIDEPRVGGHYGGIVAAPVFASVMREAVRILNISPDAYENKKPSVDDLRVADQAAGATVQ